MGRSRSTPKPGAPADTETDADADAARAEPHADTIKLGRYEVACKRIRAEVWHLDTTHRLARYRQEWPEFWEAIDDMVALLDKDHPPYPLPTSTLFDLTEG